MIFDKRWRCKLGFHLWDVATGFWGGRLIRVCRYCRVTAPAKKGDVL